jgi:ribosomal protein S12 methylthiotransferase
MRTKKLQHNKVNVITLGCSKNIYDSEVLMGQLQANNFDVIHEEDNSNAATVIINTCGFIDNAKEESVNTILQYVEAKKRGWVNKVYVTGCLSERYASELEKEIPEVDAYFGTRDLPRLLKTMKADYKHELVGERLLTTPFHYAYLKIAEGCDRPCSFCAIPLMRGTHVSTPMEELVAQTEKLAAKGVKELILIAQDLTYYGLDIYKKRTLAQLLEKLVAVEGIEWIRLHYAYPSGFPMDVLEVMKKHDKVCNYLDMPLQHVSDNMLKSMRRGITKQKTMDLVKEVRAIAPKMALRTTLIVGYPGETEEDFNELKEWVREAKFDRMGAFTYSHEEKTHAHLLEDDVPAEVKQARVDELMEIQAEVSYQLNQAKIGNTYKVLFDRKEGNYFIGRSEYDSPEVDNEILVEAKKDVYVAVGSFANVKITSAVEFDLYGELV